MICVRCKAHAKDHPKGKCPDGGGSFTWRAPRTDELRRIELLLAELLRRGASN